MNRRRIGTCLLVSAALAGCQSGERARPETVYREANRVAEPKTIVKEIEVPVATPQLRPLPAATAPAANGRPHERVIGEARGAATHRPDPAAFIEAIQTYDYLPGAVYEVYASPGHVTTIALEPGEELIAKVAGDTAQWFVGDSHTGSGPDRRTLLLVKPVKPGVQTNLVVSTDRRVYQIDLRSLSGASGGTSGDASVDASGGAYHSEVRWNYPADFARQLARRERERVEDEERVIASPLDLANLDFGYAIRSRGKGDAPDWMPRRVFTDGRKTYIGFPEALDTMEAPPLFVLGPQGDAQLVNYRVRGGYYIVDRVIGRAELRLGEAPQEVVAIERQTPDRTSPSRPHTRTPRRR